MRSLNKVLIIGNLGRDPELRYTSGGTAVAEFSVACNRKDKDGGDHTEWFSIVAWKRLAEIAGEYLRKGSRVYVEGEQHTERWTDKEGQKRERAKIQARALLMLDSKGERREGFKPDEITDDDIPF